MDDPGSLDNLRDIATGPPVTWWPLAPGWCFVMAVGILAALLLVVGRWIRWKRNAYRRAAMVELVDARDDATIAAILKRVAISAYGRGVGSLVGKRWCDWLSGSVEAPMPLAAQERLTSGVYRSGELLTPELLQFARQWISGHRVAKNSTEGRKRS